MMGYIVPNTPVSNEEKAAFEKACTYQVEHEEKLAAMMSGSGPSVFGIFEDAESACRVARHLNEEYGEEIAFPVYPTSESM